MVCAADLGPPLGNVAWCRRWKGLVCRRLGEVRPLHEVLSACSRLPTRLFQEAENDLVPSVVLSIKPRVCFRIHALETVLLAGSHHRWSPCAGKGLCSSAQWRNPTGRIRDKHEISCRAGSSQQDRKRWCRG